MQINEVLNQFGLQNKENDVYLACLELGYCGVNEIAKKANIKRTTVYDVLAGLKNKGLIGQTINDKKRLFYAESPEKLGQMLEEKQRKLAEIMPFLKSIHNTSGQKPKMRYYEGIEGLKSVYNDILMQNGEILAFIKEDVLNSLGNEFVKEFDKKRKKLNINFKIIGADYDNVIEYAKNDKINNKEIRIVKKEEFPFSLEMNIYGNCVSYVFLEEKIGIIIESTEIANNMRLLFKLAWKGTTV